MRMIIQVLTSLAHAARVVCTWALAIEGWKKVSVIQDACAEFQAAVQAESVANPKAPVQPKKAHMVSTVARMREYSGGALADALAKIHEHGFDLGCFVTRKASADLKGAEVDSSQYKVWEARGDTVVLQDQHELLCVLSADELLSCFDLVSTQTVEVVHPQWPVNYLAHTSYLAHMVKLRIMSALYTASTADYASFDRVTVMEKPRRAVRSKGEAARGALVLVPNSMKVLTKPTSDPVVEGEVRVVHPITGDFACLSGLRFVLSPLFTKELPCAAWAVRATVDERLANMSWSRVKVSDVGVSEGPPERSRPASATSTYAVAVPTSKAKPAGPPPPTPMASAGGSAGASSVACEFALELPVLVNTKPLAAGQELLVFQAPVKAVKRRQPAPVNVAKIMKTKAKPAGPPPPTPKASAGGSA